MWKVPNKPCEEKVALGEKRICLDVQIPVFGTVDVWFECRRRQALGVVYFADFMSLPGSAYNGGSGAGKRGISTI